MIAGGGGTNPPPAELERGTAEMLQASDNSRDGWVGAREMVAEIRSH
jgi:hypothetical protein